MKKFSIIPTIINIELEFTTLEGLFLRAIILINNISKYYFILFTFYNPLL